MKTIIEKAAATLESALEYLDYIYPEAYQQPVSLLMGATIGQHTRHFVECVQCLLDQPARMGEVNYDLRQRNRELEASPAFAASAVRQLVKRLTSVDCSGDLRVAQGLAPEYSVQSSFERELLYNTDHVVHHLALIRIGIQLHAPWIRLSDHFGVAEATLKYRQQQHDRLSAAALLMAG